MAIYGKEIRDALDELQWQCNDEEWTLNTTVHCDSNLLYPILTKDTTNLDKRVSGIYYYHPDHLGSATWITNASGVPVQFIHYMPWGELWYNQQASAYNERFKFTGKERDTETGYDYFGARYYSSALPMWLSVDSHSDDYPSITPYAYCNWNPVKYVDIYGEDPVVPAPKYLMGTPQYYIFRQREFEHFNKTTEHQCYYISYGYKYADLFQQASENFSIKGKQWTQETMLNLQIVLENRLLQPDGTDFEMDENLFLDFVFDSHVDAYWNEDNKTPFYQLEMKDWIDIFNTIEWKEKLSVRGLKQEAKLVSKQLTYWKDILINWINEQKQTIKAFLSNEE